VRYEELIHESESSISECVRLCDARGLMIRDNKPHPKAYDCNREVAHGGCLNSDHCGHVPL